MAAFDGDAFELSVHDRLGFIQDLRHVDSADELEPALLRAAANVPAVYTLIDSMPSDGALVHNSIGQKKALLLDLLIVTQSFKTLRESTKGNYLISRLVQAQLITKLWMPAGAAERFKYVNYEFFARAASRVAYRLRLRTSVYDTFV